MTIAKGSVSVPCEGWGNQRAADKYSFDEASGEVIAKELYADSERSRKVRGWIYSVQSPGRVLRYLQARRIASIDGRIESYIRIRDLVQ